MVTQISECTTFSQRDHLCPYESEMVTEYYLFAALAYSPSLLGVIQYLWVMYVLLIRMGCGSCDPTTCKLKETLSPRILAPTYIQGRDGNQISAIQTPIQKVKKLEIHKKH